MSHGRTRGRSPDARRNQVAFDRDGFDRLRCTLPARPPGLRRMERARARLDVSPNMNDLFALIGPTASGKSALAIGCAEALGGEIVSVDSAQVFRGLDVGTAKP